jgi:transposase
LWRDPWGSREVNRLKPSQAQTIVAAAILWQLYAVIIIGQAWDAHIATHGLQRRRDNMGVVAA